MQKDKIIKKKSIDKNEGGKGYFREPWMVNTCSREMLDFSVVKCDLFYSREAWSIVDKNAPW
jgi:hypothetical protein